MTENLKDETKTSYGTTDVENNASKDKNEVSVLFFSSFAAIDFLLVLIGIISIVLMGVLCVSYDCIVLVFVVPYYVIAGVLYLLTGIFAIVLTKKQPYSFLIVTLVFAVISIVASLPPVILMLISIPSISWDKLFDTLFFILLLATLLEFIFMLITMIKCSTYIHRWKH